MDAKANGAKICAIDVRLSNTASMADYWLAPYPGTEAMLLLAFAHVILQEDLFDRSFLEEWVNWRDFLSAHCPNVEPTFDCFIDELKKHYAIHVAVGRPGADGYMDRVLQSWGIDGHNSHTNVCSSSARLGYALWSGADRPSPDHANAKFILLLSAHLETGHYFNPHAQRIMDAKANGAKICAIDVRLSNTASMADYWLAPYPGTEAMLLLAFAHVILQEDLFDRSFLEEWVNWRDFLSAHCPNVEPTFDCFIDELKKHHANAKFILLLSSSCCCQRIWRQGTISIHTPSASWMRRPTARKYVRSTCDSPIPLRWLTIGSRPTPALKRCSCSPSRT